VSERNPNIPQLDFPELAADLISELRLTKIQGLLDFTNTVQPVYIVSARGGALTVTAGAPLATPGEMFNSHDINPAVNTVLADTGALVAGDYDVHLQIGYVELATAGNSTPSFQHRNAANTATLANLQVPFTFTGPATQNVWDYSYAISIETNERLRWQVETFAFAGILTTAITAIRRPAP